MRLRIKSKFDVKSHLRFHNKVKAVKNKAEIIGKYSWSSATLIFQKGQPIHDVVRKCCDGMTPSLKQ